MTCRPTLLIVFSLIIHQGQAQDTVHVQSGWNIIGSVKSGAVPDVLTTIPDSLINGSFFGYRPGFGYQSTMTLGKGLGYWVKAKADGAIVFDTAPAPDECKSKAFIYQGKFYNTVKIGDQCWMAENLDVGTMILGVSNQTDNGTTEMFCYNNDPAQCTLYGGLYQWNEAMQYSVTPGTQGICPSGWHIPTSMEFQTFSSAVGGDGNSLKAIGQGAGGGAGINTSGFSVLLTGWRNGDDGRFTGFEYLANVWSSTENNGWDAFIMWLDDYYSSVNLGGTSGKNMGFSVRCLED
jgi:uncharacterized protein (TIGR02145 family)